MTKALPNGNFPAMNVAIDKMGRVVVPKPVRDQFALEAGSELELHVDSEGIHLRPVVASPTLEERDGILVCVSEVPPSAWDLGAFIEGQRNLRSKELGGLGA